jgi:predicted GTPase
MSKDEFKQNRIMDRSGHTAFETAELKKVVSAIRPRKEINVVVLGETGVGKSTWINALANYISYESMDDALNSELINLIATEFSITEKAPGTLKLVQKQISIGKSPNETFKKGQSATQMPRAYTFPEGETLYRIIDTPGIGDSRGLAQDKQNMENIMHFIARYEQIHAICILMKPNESRLTPTFEFCFKELLMQFHRSAAKNIVFCFTNTSGYGFDVIFS